jgi:hypothetical protein
LVFEDEVPLVFEDAGAVDENLNVVVGSSIVVVVVVKTNGIDSVKPGGSEKISVGLAIVHTI